MDTDGNNQDLDCNMEAAPFSGENTGVSAPHVGADIDMISSQFRTTSFLNDKEQLVMEFRRLSNTELSNEGCTFYLDMAEWNLNAALWAYYEYETAAAANTAAISTNLTGNVSNTLTTT